MGEYEALSARIDEMNIDIRETRKDLSTIKENMAKYNVLTEQCINSYDKLNNTMDVFKDTMQEVTRSLKDSNEKMESFEERLNDTNQKMDENFASLRGEVELVDEKSKVDVLAWLKDNWLKLAILVGGGSLAVDKISGIF
jgi:chromosome segregation ATPase